MPMLNSNRMRTRRLNFRATQRQEKLLRTGAEASGVTLTEFILNSACAQAEQVLTDKREFILSPSRWQKFAKELDRPARSKPELAALFSNSSLTRP
jgi:uncharacterized protein (DUF1778 family)